MKVVLACLADNASADNVGKLSVNGIFDNIRAQTAPVVQPRMFLVFRVMFENEDGGSTHDIRIRILNEDAVQLAEVKGKLTSPERIPPGSFEMRNTIFELNGFTFPKFGRYIFELVADDEEPVNVPLDVRAL